MSSGKHFSFFDAMREAAQAMEKSFWGEPDCDSHKGLRKSLDDPRTFKGIVGLDNCSCPRGPFLYKGVTIHINGCPKQ